MSTSARRSCASLLIAACLIAGPRAASAQQLQVDPGALDASGSVTTQPKAKKAKAQQAPRAGAGQQQQGGGGSRQFGELEGWSTGKAAPPGGKQKEDETPSSPNGKLPIGVSPSGNMSVGLPF
ncbi:hypothetical protein [Methylocystis sp. SB2]|uniref:hypothetical protein n=1 Tax=Methylocystis sp. (strain SB2) TaxID=743836 RepID=UPI00041F62EF|nr:hypothetical protein [Methylocystis sp. SB2]ULO24555.1 hypothetical protein LNB28_03880 [Methylocystis sp. SB2]